MKKRIRKIRKFAKLTQTEFGELIGVKGNTITGYETGRRTPTDAIILSICREFNVNEDWLRTGEVEMFTKTQSDELDEIASRYNLDDVDRRMLTAYLELPADSRAVIKDYIHRVANAPGDAASPDDRSALHQALDADTPKP